MRVIKRLYWFIIKSFLPLFTMTFFIVLFILLMQFLWRYISELVGKGLEISVLLELFFFASLTMVPMALPLAILLASLMLFGNLGEKSELTAIKASGIPLITVMKPLIILVMAIAVGAFFFQNDVLPKSQVKMWTLLFSMRQKSPEVEIPEGAFYDQIPGYSVYIKGKNRESGMLYDAMIYDISRGGDNSTILLADSAKMAFTNDMQYLYLHLFTGEQFENLREQRQLDQNVPFRRETFYDKEILIPFDANFNRMDEGGIRKQYVGKNMAELRQSIDSIGSRIDSLGSYFSREFKYTGFPSLLRSSFFDSSDNTTGLQTNNSRTTLKFASGTNDPEANFESDEPMCLNSSDPKPLDFDSIINSFTPTQQEEIYGSAIQLNRNKTSDLEYRALVMREEKLSMRRHDIELLKKFTLSVACIIFFFIGAPLGAIIRKGGLGMPLVISVLLFVVYYLIDNTGFKMARDGRVDVWFGIWLSTFILLPLGVFVTYKAMNDSAVFNKDLYLAMIRKIFGLSEDRHLPLKEVIISEVSNREIVQRLAHAYALSSYWLKHNHLPVSYKDYWFKGYDQSFIQNFGNQLDEMAVYISDSRNLRLLMSVEAIPVLKNLWILNPVPKRFKRLRKAIAIIFPIGGVLYLLSIPYARKLQTQMKKVKKQTLIALTHVSHL